MIKYVHELLISGNISVPMSNKNTAIEFIRKMYSCYLQTAKVSIIYNFKDGVLNIELNQKPLKERSIELLKWYQSLDGGKLYYYEHSCFKNEKYNTLGNILKRYGVPYKDVYENGVYKRYD